MASEKRLQKFCPKCGKDVDHLVKGLCEECYTGEHELIEVPNKVTAEICKSCGRIKVRGRWEEKLENPKEIAVRNAVKTKGEVAFSVECGDQKCTVKAQGFLREEQKDSKHEEHEVLVRTKKRLCDDCSKMRGGYYEAVLQIRSDDERRIHRMILLMGEILDEPRGDRWFVTKVEEVTGGVDIYLGSKAMLTAFQRELKRDVPGAETTDSYELFGMKDGKKVYRNYLAVRL